MNRSFLKKLCSLSCALVLTGILNASASAADKVPCRQTVLTNENFLPALLKSIDESRGEILMCLFSFKAGEHKSSYPDRIVRSLANAVKRGVKVFVVLERSRPTDDLDVQNMKTAGILTKKGVGVFFDSPRKTTHTKLAVIDSRFVFLGSHNLTQSALKYNNEISVMLDNPELARDARGYILKIIEEGK